MVMTRNCSTRPRPRVRGHPVTSMIVGTVLRCKKVIYVGPYPDGAFRSPRPLPPLTPETRRVLCNSVAHVRDTAETRGGSFIKWTPGTES